MSIFFSFFYSFPQTGDAASNGSMPHIYLAYQISNQSDLLFTARQDRLQRSPPKSHPKNRNHAF
jgi:hypothetical protein